MEGVTGEYYVAMKTTAASEDSRDPDKAKKLFGLTAEQVGLTTQLNG